MFFIEKPLEIEACGKPVCTWPECDGSCEAEDPEQLILLLQKQAQKQEKKENVTYADWIKDPNTPIRDIVHFLTQPCTYSAMAQYCDHFENCEDCRVSWAMSTIKGE